MKNRGIYIHIPFCKKKCDYCDFTSYSYSDIDLNNYVDFLCREIELYSEELNNSNITSIYFGGGTPSVLNCEQINRIFNILNRYFKKGIEITFEVNPESINIEKLQFLRKLGVNRISMGLQSLNDKDLTFLGRIHNSNDALEIIKALYEMKFNYNIDFIYGFDKNRNIIDEIEKVLIFKPKHISLYPLEIYSSSKISSKIKAIDDEFAFKQYKEISKYLRECGFIHYEVSNFALKGYESVHNSNYWRCNEYFGFGVSSHGYLNDIRYENTKSLSTYKNMIENAKRPIINNISITLDDSKDEFIMLGLRLSEGISLSEYEKKFGSKFDRLNDKRVKRLLTDGFLLLEDGYLKITEEGSYQMNNILVDLL